jgi:hypothetical protein
VPATKVSIQAAGGDGVNTFLMQAFNSSNTLIGTANYSGQFFGPLSISAPDITRVVLIETSSGPTFVYDDLVFEVVPEPSTGLLVIAGLFGLAAQRRSRS